jgi:hypothetical protein
VAALALFFWAMFTVAGFVVIGLRAGAKSYPPGQTSMVAGMAAGTWSAIVALLLPLLGAWFDRKLYTQTYVMISLMPVLGTLSWWLLHRSGSPSRAPQA